MHDTSSRSLMLGFDLGMNKKTYRLLGFPVSDAYVECTRSRVVIS